MAAFPVCVCADIDGRKVNLEIPFNARPAMAELNQRIREFFDYESSASRPGNLPGRPFAINRMQIYTDDPVKPWDDLQRSEQLRPHSQIYVFQPNVIDTPADLPPPQQPKHPMVSGGMQMQSYDGASIHQSQPPVGYGQATYHGQSQVSIGRAGERPHVESDEKIRIVFSELDQSGKQFLDYSDLEKGFKQRGLHFAVNTIGELFHKADRNRDGRIMFDEWVNWCGVYPNTLDAMYYRGKDTGEEAQIRHQMRELQELNDADHLAAELLDLMTKKAQSPGHLGNAVKSIDKHIAPIAQALHADPTRDVRPDLNRAVEDLSRDAAQRERKMPELDAQLRQAQERRHILEQQEMNLLEQEIRLERQRDAMRAQEAKYQEAEQLFNSKANETGSPRRARRVISPSVK